MTRRHWREIAERFTHIDAEFVACALGFPEDEPYFRVRFYPWWEHPGYDEARASALVRDVTVYPLGLRAFRLGARTRVNDWQFTEGGRHVWPYEPQGQLFVNGAVDRAELIEAVDERLDAGIAAIGARIAAPQWTPPLSLYLPRSVLVAAIDALEERQVDCFTPGVPDAVPTPTAFVIEGEDYILADDFEVDVPEL